jgi:hypothetical protein
VDGRESPFGETQSRQQLMNLPVAPRVETCGVSAQKSAEGIVVVTDEGSNVERSVATL